MANQPLYDISIIKDILPHRSPFLFVDRIMAWKAGERIVSEKDLSPDESFFAGHFPGNPIMPGVLVSEALAQTSGLLMGLTWNAEDRATVGERPGFLYLASANMKFSSPARPGETLRLEAELKKEYGSMFLFNVAAYVKDRSIASGTLTLAQEKHQGQ
ncbi:MAG: beta-hydroxyacyl-ACP dehydratase [Deltaproteobacteria bacterium]|nr:beta-hydroxyacyl-ACP dehydratase [Deltaproteobacteria bacterium]